MNEILVRSQLEFDNLPKSFDRKAIVKIDAKNITIRNNILNCDYWLINSSTATLLNRSTATLRDSSTATLRNNSTATFWDRSTATLLDRSTATLLDRSTATLLDRSTATLLDRSTATLYDSSTATLYDNSTATLLDRSTATLRNNSTATFWDRSTATLLDRSTATLRNNSTATLLNSSYVFVNNDNRVTAYENSMVAGIRLHKTTVHDNATKKQITNLSISFDTWLERGFVVCDGIYQNYISEEKHGEIILYKTDVGFVARKDNVFSHGKTKYTAFSDLRFKLSKRNTNEFRSWNKEQKRNIEDLIYCYRLITGACSFGCENFCKGLDTEKQYSINEVIELTNGQYGHDKFREFFV